MRIREPNLTSAYAIALAHRLASKADATGFGSSAKAAALQTNAAAQGGSFDRAMNAVDEAVISYNSGDGTNPALPKTPVQISQATERTTPAENTGTNVARAPVSFIKANPAPEAPQAPTAQLLTPAQTNPPASPQPMRPQHAINEQNLPAANQPTTGYRPPVLASPPQSPVFASPIQMMPQPNAVSALYQVTQTQQNAVALCMPKDLPKTADEIRKKDLDEKEKKNEKIKPLSYFL